MDSIQFNEGLAYLTANGLPATCRFLLSTKAVSAFAVTDTLAGAGSGEISGTGYARQSEARPVPVGETITFTQLIFDNLGASNWPNNIASWVLVTSADNSGKMLCAANLVAGGTVRDLSVPFTQEKVIPIIAYTAS